MFNTGDFKRFLSEAPADAGDGSPVGIPQLAVEDGKPAEMAKTFLKKTLAQHDAVYHKGGYRPGDECNFRKTLAAADDSDKLSDDGGGERVKYGLVKYREVDGKREIVGIEEVAPPGEGGKDDGIADLMQDIEADEVIESRKATDRYLGLVDAGERGGGAR